jgi:membrane-associated phospholipid phosphatase
MKNYTFVDYATQAYIALVGMLILCFHNSTVPKWPSMVVAHVACLGVVHGLIQWYSRAPLGKLVGFLRHFYPVLLYTWFFSETGWLNRMFFQGYLDPVIIRWDQAMFGCQPSVMFMEKLPWLAVSEVFYASYFSYYVMISGVGLALYLRDRRQFFHYVSVVSFVFYICYLIYIVLPVIGPRVFFHDVAGYIVPPEIQALAPTDSYPDAVRGGVFYKIMAWIYQVFEAPGAAIPSSHVAVALTTVFISFQYLRRIRFLHLLVAIILCFSTIYCRYHYVADVLAGALTAALLIPLGNWLYFRFGSGQQIKPGQKTARETMPSPTTK